MYAQLQQTCLDRIQSEHPAIDPAIVRRATRLTVMELADRMAVDQDGIFTDQEIADRYADVDERKLIQDVRRRYSSTYGMPIIGFILLQIFIGIVVRLIVHFLIEWWENRQQVVYGAEADMALIALLRQMQLEAEQDRA